jgi:hypothetical protein
MSCPSSFEVVTVTDNAEAAVAATTVARITVKIIVNAILTFILFSPSTPLSLLLLFVTI